MSKASKLKTQAFGLERDMAEIFEKDIDAKGLSKGKVFSFFVDFWLKMPDEMQMEFLNSNKRDKIINSMIKCYLHSDMQRKIDAIKEKLGELGDD